MKLTNASFRAENPSVWEKVRQLWLLRNEVAHGRASEQAKIKTQLDSIGDVQTAAFETIGWLRSKRLQHKPAQLGSNFPSTQSE